MAVTVPTAWQSTSPPATPIVHGATVRQVHAKAYAENDALIRSLLPRTWGFSDDIQSTSATYATVIDEVPFTVHSSTTDVLTVLGRIADGDARVSVTDGALTVTGTISEATATESTQTTTIDVSTLSGSTFRLKVEVRKTTTQVTLAGLLVEEQAMVAATIA